MIIRYDDSESLVLAGEYRKGFGEDLRSLFPQVSYDSRKTIVQHSTIVLPLVELFNIEFRVHNDGSYYHLISDQWPILTAFGGTFKEAVHELQALLKDLIQEYVMVPESTLAPESIAFRKFLLAKLFQ